MTSLKFMSYWLFGDRLRDFLMAAGGVQAGSDIETLA